MFKNDRIYTKNRKMYKKQMTAWYRMVYIILFLTLIWFFRHYAIVCDSYWYYYFLIFLWYNFKFERFFLLWNHRFTHKKSRNRIQKVRNLMFRINRMRKKGLDSSVSATWFFEHEITIFHPKNRRFPNIFKTE